MLLFCHRAYCPDTQAPHAPPGKPANPGSQVQFSAYDPFFGDVAFSGHWYSSPVQHHVRPPHSTHGVLFTPFSPLSQ